jgi:hypothetical protein
MEQEPTRERHGPISKNILQEFASGQVVKNVTTVTSMAARKV